MLGAVVAMAAVALALALAHVDQNVSEARLALASGQKLIKAGQFDEAAATLRHGVDLLEYVPANHELREQLLRALDLAPRAKLAEDLHGIADRFRSMYGALPQISSRLQKLDNQCGDLWKNRQIGADKLGKDLDAEVKQRVHLDLLELAVSGSNLHVGLAPAGREDAARREALAGAWPKPSALFGPSRGPLS